MIEAVNETEIDEVYWQVLRAVGVTAASAGLLLIAAVGVAAFGQLLIGMHHWSVLGVTLLLIVLGTWGTFEALAALHDVRHIQADWERLVLRYTLLVMTATNTIVALSALISAAWLLAALTRIAR